VVLAAREEEALLRVAAECVLLGGKALAAPTDVSDSGAVEELARVAGLAEDRRVHRLRQDRDHVDAFVARELLPQALRERSDGDLLVT